LIWTAILSNAAIPKVREVAFLLTARLSMRNSSPWHLHNKMAHMQRKGRITERGTENLSAFNNEPRGRPT
jgi:hypothetical protein